jgi:hypothetical protein
MLPNPDFVGQFVTQGINFVQNMLSFRRDLSSSKLSSKMRDKEAAEDARNKKGIFLGGAL